MRISDNHLGPLLIIPAFATLIFITIYPLIYAIWISLQKWNYLKVYIEPEFIGGGNYLAMLSDPDFANTIMVTVGFTAASVSAQVGIGILIALLLFMELRGKRVIRSLVLIPMMVTPVVVGLMHKYILNRAFGVINYFLSFIGITGIPWYASAKTSLATMVIIDTWQWTPLVVLIVVAALSSVPVEPYEAAIIDGATRLQTFRYITLPMIKGAIVMAALIRIIDAMREFDKVYVLTRGGPGHTTDVFSIFGFRTAFLYGDVGYAAAISIILFIMVMLACTILIKIMRFK